LPGQARVENLSVAKIVQYDEPTSKRHSINELQRRQISL